MADEPDDTGRKQAETQFKPGQSGNPNGRPKGARSKLGEAFIEALHEDFSIHGVKAIERTRLEKPDQYVKVIASLLPKEFKIETVSELTNEQLDAKLRQFATLLAEAGVLDAPRGEEASEGSQTAH